MTADALIAPGGLTARQRAVLPGTALDRRIRVLKLLLPAAAIGVLGYVLAETFAARDELSFVISRQTVATSPERLRVREATYRGIDNAGRPFTIEAEGAVQQSAARPVVVMTGIAASIALANGPARLTAPGGELEIDSDRLRLQSPVRAEQGGYLVDSGSVAVDLKTQQVTSSAAVTGRTPLGRFSASRFSADVQGRRVILSGGARLRIDRQRAS